MFVIQLSDIHLRAPGKLLYRQIDTAAALTKAIQRINAMRPQPTAVVLSGDLTERGDDDEYAHLRLQLAQLKTPWHLLPGNHDQRENLRAAFPEQNWQGAPLCCQRIDLAGLQSLCLLLLDSTIPGEEGGMAGDEQLAWLDAACPASTPCLLFLHHPPIAVGIAGMDRARFRHADRLADWLRPRPHIRLLAAGHLHRAICGQFAGRPLLVAPSTAHQIAFDLSGDPNATAWCREPGGMLAHFVSGDHVVTHVVPVLAAETVAYR